ncbi:hypothetical protein HDZ31DRAFT_273, partial [Schizophyllum fasciatum]
VLFITNSEQGQSSIHLATTFELAQSQAVADKGVEVHLASFAELRGRFESMAANVSRAGKCPPTFHVIEGLPHFVAMARIKEYMPLQHPPTLEACPKFVRLMVPWTPEEY